MMNLCQESNHRVLGVISAAVSGISGISDMAMNRSSRGGQLAGFKLVVFYGRYLGFGVLLGF